MKQVWKEVYAAARNGEICCGLSGVPSSQIRLALIACVKAGVLTAGEVGRARQFWNK